MSILLYECATLTLTKRMEKKLDADYKRMLRAILNKPWRQYPKKQLSLGHLPSITKNIHVKRTKRARRCWRSKDERISDVLQSTSSHERANTGRPARITIQQPCADKGCSLEDLSGAMDDRDRWREKVREIRAVCMT